MNSRMVNLILFLIVQVEAGNITDTLTCLTYYTGTTVYGESVAIFEVNLENKQDEFCNFTFRLDAEKEKGDRKTICLHTCVPMLLDNFNLNIRPYGENANDGWKIELLEINSNRYSLDGKVPQLWVDGDKGGYYDAPLCFGGNWCRLKKIEMIYVCLDLTVMTKYDGHQLRWGLGNCSNDDETYKDYMTYDRICCVEPRRYTLTCKNTLKPHGWKRGYIEILGRRYCDDFMGYSAFRSLDIIEEPPKNLDFTMAITQNSSTLPNDFMKQTINETAACCSDLLINSFGTIRQFYTDVWGHYRVIGYKNNGPKPFQITNEYKIDNFGFYLFFDDTNKQWTVSTSPNSDPFFHEPTCNETCPEDCLSGKWKFWDSNHKSWVTDQVINIDCEVSGIMNRPPDGCPEDTSGCNSPGCPNTCYCEDHCSWDKCILLSPPDECLHGTDSEWFKDTELNYWVAKIKEKNASNSSKIIKESEDHEHHHKDRNMEDTTYKDALKKMEDIKVAQNTAIMCLIVSFAVGSFLYLFRSPKKILDDPKIFLRRGRTVFGLTCFLLASYMVLTQVVRFLENYDTSTIKHKRFNRTPRDKYPTYSICFKGSEIYWLNEKSLFSILGVTSEQYTKILQGDGWKYDYKNQNNYLRKVPLDLTNASNPSIRDVTMKPWDIFSEFNFVYENNNDSKVFKKGKEKDNPFYVGYMTSDEICYTRSSLDPLDAIRLYDLILLEKFLVTSGCHFNIELKIIFHYPGQLLRNFDNPTFKSTLGSYEKDKTLELKILQVTKLINRRDSYIQCNNVLENDDEKLIMEIIKIAGCVPPYWKFWTKTIYEKECKTAEQLKIVHHYIGHYKALLSTYDPPCLDMNTLVSYAKETSQTERQFKFRIVYTVDEFQEITNVKEFTFEMFWSSVGGFLGIFLGYSVLQVPELIIHLMPVLRNLKI